MNEGEARRKDRRNEGGKAERGKVGKKGRRNEGRKVNEGRQEGKTEG